MSDSRDQALSRLQAEGKVLFQKLAEEHEDKPGFNPDQLYSNVLIPVLASFEAETPAPLATYEARRTCAAIFLEMADKLGGVEQTSRFSIEVVHTPNGVDAAGSPPKRLTGVRLRLGGISLLIEGEYLNAATFLFADVFKRLLEQEKEDKRAAREAKKSAKR